MANVDGNTIEPSTKSSRIRQLVQVSLGAQHFRNQLDAKTWPRGNGQHAVYQIETIEAAHFADVRMRVQAAFTHIEVAHRSTEVNIGHVVDEAAAVVQCNRQAVVLRKLGDSAAAADASAPAKIGVQHIDAALDDKR